MSQVELYSRVKIITDRFRDEGAPLGTVGYVIDDWKDATGQLVAYEVEVMDEGGRTLALVSPQVDEVEPVDTSAP